MKRILLTLSFLLGATVHADQGADLQFYLCDKPQVVRDALQVDKGDAKERDVYLFESSKLELFDRGLQIRLRVKNDKGTLSVKRFDLTQSDFDSYQKQINGKCEMDVHSGGSAHILSCSADQKISAQATAQLLKGKIAWADVVSADQLLLLKDATLTNVQALGPIKSRAYDVKADGFSDRLALEAQTLPSGNKYIEFSIKTQESALSEQIKNAQSLFQDKGLTLCADQAGQREQKLRDLLKK